jgi:acetoacetyl-CoA synthetase
MASTAQKRLLHFLAANALGAVWSSCSPDFGTDAVCDRFAQLAPKVLLAHQQYTYGGKAFDVKTKIKTISDSIGSIENTLLLDDYKDFDDDFVAFDQIHVEAVSFSDPIWVLFSSGTTGKPKAIVHGAGTYAFGTSKGVGIASKCIQRGSLFLVFHNWLDDVELRIG